MDGNDSQERNSLRYLNKWEPSSFALPLRVWLLNKLADESGSVCVCWCRSVFVYTGWVLLGVSHGDGLCWVLRCSVYERETQAVLAFLPARAGMGGCGQREANLTFPSSSFPFQGSTSVEQ